MEKRARLLQQNLIIMKANKDIPTFSEMLGITCLLAAKMRQSNLLFSR